MDLDTVIIILVGSTLGLIFRLIIKKLFYFKYSLIVNILSSLFLGVFLALNPTNKNLILFFSVGFLGCFSTFSSFIYQLFKLIQRRKYVSLVIYYIEVLVLTYLFFCLGYLTTFILKNWKKIF